MKKSMILFAAAGIAASAMAQNTGALILDGDALFRLGLTTGGTAFPTNNTAFIDRLTTLDLRISGRTAPIDHLRSMGWFVGTLGGFREFNLGGVTSNFTRNVSGNSITYSVRNAFSINGLDAVYTATLRGNGLGLNTAQVINTMTLTNNSATDQVLDLFCLIDSDVAASPNGDIIDPLLIENGARVLVQRDNATGVGGPYAVALIGYGADASSAGGFNATANLLTNQSRNFTFLQDAGAEGITTPGDYYQIVQWRRELAAGASVTVRADFVAGGGAGTVVPTPGAAALAGLGLLAAGRRRR